MSGSNTVSQNMDSLINYLSKDIPALAVIRGGYIGYPLTKGARIDHIVVIFAYNRMQDEFGRSAMDPKNTRNMDLLEYYEPFNGIMGTVRRKEVTSNGSTSAFNIANFSFLAVGT